MADCPECGQESRPCLPRGRAFDCLTCGIHFLVQEADC